MPAEINGPNGTSDLIVRLFLKSGKLMSGFIFFSKRARIEKTAPIQKDRMTAERPLLIPKKTLRTKIYLTSPRPNQVPFEKRKIRKNGVAIIIPKSKEDKNEKFGTPKKLKRIEKIKRKKRNESGMIKCLKS